MTTKRYRTSPTASRAAVRSYESKLDSKKRLVIRGARHKYYQVREEPNGSIVLTPSRLVSDITISKRTLAMIESSMENFKKGIVSEPIDLTPYVDRFGLGTEAPHTPAKRRKTHRRSKKTK
ncbi:MAG: hypothetical protein ACHQNE_00975 [Candidatus Kapaibacterium sp.]